MKRIPVFFLIFFFMLMNCKAQVQFQRTFGIGLYNEGRCVKQTSDGGYIVAGTASDAGAGSADFYAVKTDSLGNFQWHKIYGGNNIDRAFSVLQTSDSGYVICGYTNSSNVNNNYDGYLVRTNKNGDTLWTKKYGGIDWDFFYSMRQTPDAGFILAGNSYSNPTGNSEVFLVKTDSTGNIEWTRNLDLTDDAFINAITISPDASFVLAGYKSNLTTADNDFLVIKTNLSGDTLWTKTFGNANAEERGNAIDVSLNDSAIVAAGYSKDLASGNSDSYFIRINNDGTSTASVFSQPMQEAAYDIHFIPFGVVGCGYTSTFGAGNEDTHFYTLDSGATYQKTGTTLGGIETDIGYHIEQTSDNGFIMCGSTTSFTPGLQALYLVKFTYDTAFHTSSLIIGVKEPVFTDEVFSNYPNPFHDYTIIDLKGIPSSADLSLKVFAMTGETVFSSSVTTKNQVTFYSNNLPPGIYLYRIFDSQNIYRYGKLVIQ